MGKSWSSPSKRILILLCLLSLAQAGCSTLPYISRPVAKSDNFAIHVASNLDTLEKLSKKYYGTPDKTWIIKQYNGKTSLRPGDEILVPYEKATRGGILAWGYQVVPVICYHKVAPVSTDKMTLTTVAFQRQMAFLKDNGYYALSLEEFSDFINYKYPIPQKSVLITFDDGWKSFYEQAHPILKSHGFKATVFLPTDFINAAGAISWDTVADLKRQGYDFQSHTKSHEKLSRKAGESTSRYRNRLATEFAGSKKIIEKKTGAPVDYMAYTFNDINADIVAAAQKAGYKGAFTVMRGLNPFFVNNYAIRRHIIYPETSFKKFSSYVRGFTRNNLKGY